MTIKNLLSTSKRRISAGIISGALVVTAGAMTTFAAKQDTPSDASLVQVEDGTASYSTDGGATWSEGMPEGTTQYSLDNGETWNEGLPPEGSGEESLIIHGGDSAPDLEEGGSQMIEGSVMVQNENGVASYSTDGGQTWSSVPDGFEVTVEVTEEDGQVSIKMDSTN